MPTNSVIGLLASQSATKLEAMEQAIDEQIADLRSQKELVGRALTEKGVRPKNSPSNGSSEKPSSRKRRQRNSRTGSSSVIREVLQEQPERIWMPIEIISAAQERGVTSTPQAIRVALRRMGEQGFVARGPDGTGWRLAPAAQNGSSGGAYGGSDTTSPPNAHDAGRGGEVG